jgi:hypothetical protein
MGFLQALIEAGLGVKASGDLLVLDLNDFPGSGYELVDQALLLRATGGMGPDWGGSRHTGFHPNHKPKGMFWGVRDITFRY